MPEPRLLVIALPPVREPEAPPPMVAALLELFRTSSILADTLRCPDETFVGVPGDVLAIASDASWEPCGECDVCEHRNAVQGVKDCLEMGG
jgi:hypothetical protein